jgi:hypothetical protein
MRSRVFLAQAAVALPEGAGQMLKACEQAGAGAALCRCVLPPAAWLAYCAQIMRSLCDAQQVPGLGTLAGIKGVAACLRLCSWDVAQLLLVLLHAARQHACMSVCVHPNCLGKACVHTSLAEVLVDPNTPCSLVQLLGRTFGLNGLYVVWYYCCDCCNDLNAILSHFARLRRCLKVFWHYRCP